MRSHILLVGKAHRRASTCRQLASLSFGEPDTDTFRCLKLADIAGREGGTLPCVLNAADEVAVDAFLHNRCSFTDIDAIVEHATDQHDNSPVYSLDQLSDTDAWARTQARCALDRILALIIGAFHVKSPVIYCPNLLGPGYPDRFSCSSMREDIFLLRVRAALE